MAVHQLKVLTFLCPNYCYVGLALLATFIPTELLWTPFNCRVTIGQIKCFVFLVVRKKPQSAQRLHKDHKGFIFLCGLCDIRKYLLFCVLCFKSSNMISYLTTFAITIVACWIILSIILAFIGSATKLGFWLTLITSIVLSPIVGCVIIAALYMSKPKNK